MIIRTVESGGDLGARARRLQQAVLRPNGPLPQDTALPATAVTIAAYDDRDLLGAVTVTPEPWPRPELARVPEPQWHLRSLAVGPAARGRGLGGQLVAAATDHAATQGAAAVWAEIRVAALPVYERLGWVSVGAEWDKPGVGPHRYGWVALV